MQLIVHHVERDADGADTTWTPKLHLENAPDAFTLGAAGDIVIGGDDQVMPEHVRVAITGNNVEVTPIAGTTMYVFLGKGSRIERQHLQEPMRIAVGPRTGHLRIGNTVVQFRPAPVTQPEIPSNAGLPIGNPPPPRPPPRIPVRTTTWSEDAVEHGFVATLRDAPADTATRAVYADWLEERDYVYRATFVRGEVGYVPEPLPWRAVVSRATLPCYGRDACPKTWDALAPTPEDDLARTCAVCSRRIRFDEFNPTE
jgi:uncharacterized protein (TIGR02996 family)